MIAAAAALHGGAGDDQGAELPAHGREVLGVAAGDGKAGGPADVPGLPPAAVTTAAEGRGGRRMRGAQGVDFAHLDRIVVVIRALVFLSDVSVSAHDLLLLMVLKG